MALSSSSSSVFTNIDTMLFTGNIVGPAVTFPTSVLQVTFGNNIFVSTFTNGATKSVNLDSLSSFTFGTDRLIPNTNGLSVLGDNTHYWKNVYTKEGLVLDGGIVVTTGVNSPGGVLSAPVGSLYLRSNGGANSTLYVKESGTDASGWVAK
jgi:hypothetical protein